MISIRRIRPGEGQLYKDVRLASLKDSPASFGTSYESALGRSDETWSAQADRSAVGNDRCIMLVFDEGSPVGITTVYRDETSRDVAELLQVWMAPEFRGTGAAEQLLDAVLDWCAEVGIRRVLAGITPGNNRALRFYEKHGFEVVSSGVGDPPGGTVMARNVGSQR